MSGVNAHAILRPAPGSDARVASTELAWQKTRLHCLPPQFALASRGVARASANFVEVVCLIRNPRMAWLRDCAVAGRAILPPSALLEAAVAALCTAFAGTIPARMGLSAIELYRDSTAAVAALGCSVGLRNGSVTLAAEGSGLKLLAASALSVPPTKQPAAQQLSAILPSSSLQGGTNAFAVVKSMRSDGYVSHPGQTASVLCLATAGLRQPALPSAIEALHLTSLDASRITCGLSGFSSDSEAALRSCSSGQATYVRGLRWRALDISRMQRVPGVIYDVEWEVGSTAPMHSGKQPYPVIQALQFFRGASHRK